MHFPATLRRSRLCALRFPRDLRCIPHVGELFDVVHQAKQQPLAVHFGTSAQREAIQSFVVPHVRKHRLDRRDTLPVLCATLGRIEALLHAHRVRLALRVLAPSKERDVADHGRLGRAQTLRAQRTRRAIAFRPAKVLAHIPVRHVARAFAVQGLPRRTHTRARVGVICEITRRKHRERARGVARLIVQRIRRTRVVVTRGKSFVALPHIRIGNERGHTQRRERGEIRFAVVARIGGEHRFACAQGRERGHHRQQQFVFGAGTVRLRIDNDLVFRIDRRDARVPLDHAFVRGHLRALVVRAIALAQTARRATAIRRMRREPRAQLLCIAGEPCDPRGGLGGDIGLELQRVGCPVPVEHCLRGLLQFLGALRELGARPAPVLRRITRQFHAIDRKHLAPDQPLPVADRQHRRKDLRDVVAERADKVRDGGEVRRGHAAERHERDVLLAHALDRAAADDPLRVREQHDLE